MPPRPEDQPPDGGLLDAVRDSVLQLVARLPRLPSSLRVAAGDVTVEAEWDAGAAASANGASAANGAAGVVDPADPAEPAATGGAEGADDLAYVRSPTVGSFFRAPEPGAPPFVEVADSVVAGQQVAVVESMKLFFAVNADADGTVVEVLKDDGAPVEHGEPLLALRPSAVIPSRDP